jgi:hypothetical protein
MKNSKEYSTKIAKLFRELKQKHSKAKKPVYDDPIESLIFAVIRENCSQTATKPLMRKLQKYFADFNELRVSKTEEIMEVLGSDDDDFHKAADSIKVTLGSIFGKYNNLDLSELNDMGKKLAKKELEGLDISRFALNYCFVTFLGGHAIPLTEKMVEYLRSEKLVYPDSTIEQIEGFLERQITAANGFSFYSALSKECQKNKKAKKKTAVKSKKTTIKTETKTAETKKVKAKTKKKAPTGKKTNGKAKTKKKVKNKK